MKTSFILVWLEGPLQSWGASSKFFTRETLNFPTKSGVLGLICSAMGRRGSQANFLKELSSLSISTLAFGDSTLLNDYQNMGGGREKSSLMSLKKTGGGVISGKTVNKILRKTYLQSAAFAVVLEVPTDYLAEIECGLKTPHYEVCLGRKNCIPSEFIYQGTFETSLEALSKVKEFSNLKSLKEIFKVIEVDKVEEGCLVLNDVPLNFGIQKRYRDRVVKVVLND